MPDRVRTRRQFARFASPDARGRSGPVRVVFVDDQPEGRGLAAAYTISRKVGNAVVRNRIRRRLRVLLDEVHTSVRSGTYLIKCGNETGSLSYDQLRSHLHEALERAQLLT